jgi:Plant transposon protein
MHVYWRTCPTAWKGQYQGKHKGKASIVLEAVADYNTWFWHTAFGPPGSNNDINIWDRSPLLKAILSGYYEEELDYNYSIGSTAFSRLWFLVDGIYPELSRFVKRISVPMNKLQKRFSKWQEGKRKVVERAFGVLQ